jgi:colicin import membrane protein
MIRTAILGLLLALPALGNAQGSPESAELARINAQREHAEAEFAAQEKACYQRFAVNSCIETARKHRRDALAELRRQEIALKTVNNIGCSKV